MVHVEENEEVRRLIQETLSNEDMHVESCIGEAKALKILKTRARYDAMIVDNDAPASTGLELVQRARKMNHRRRTPIIMLSASDCETEAWGVGVDEFLKSR